MWFRKPRKPRDVHLGDKRFFFVLRMVAVFILLIFVAMVAQLLRLSWPALSKFGFSFLTETRWNPVDQSFGALSFVYGTLVSSLIALLISVPVSIGVALFLTELATKRVERILAFLVEMLAAIPSVVYGLWGIFVLAPLLRTYVEPFLFKRLGFIPLIGTLFQGAPYGVGMLSGGVILAIMITPTISAICREFFRAIPQARREAALALGSTRWEMILLSVISGARAGITGAVVLGLGRALGETMAVTMVIGNRAQIASSLFAPAQTMASAIANEYAEATGDLHLSALAAIGLVLFAVSFVINAGARFLVMRFERQSGGVR